MARANEHDPNFEALIKYLYESRGFDFSGYKRSTLRRRITKRMHEVGLEDFPGYSEYVEANPEEFQVLFDTILINVDLPPRATPKFKLDLRCLGRPDRAGAMV